MIHIAVCNRSAVVLIQDVDFGSNLILFEGNFLVDDGNVVHSKHRSIVQVFKGFTMVDHVIIVAVQVRHVNIGFIQNLLQGLTINFGHGSSSLHLVRFSVLVFALSRTKNQRRTVDHSFDLSENLEQIFLGIPEISNYRKVNFDIALIMLVLF